MLAIDPTNAWRLLEERLKTETNPLHRAHLETVIHHQKGEALGNIDQIISTLSPNCVYNVYDAPGAPPRVYRGHAGARQWYTELLETISVDLEHAVEILTLTDDYVVMDGPTRAAIPGKVLEKAGIKVQDPEAFYLIESRTLVIWPFDKDGLVLGEDIYRIGGTPLAKAAERMLHPDEIGHYPPKAA
jgi:hypothetical protein